MERKRVGIFIYEDVEVLDFCGPFEVFSVTRLNEQRRLKVVEHYFGAPIARATARHMEYPYPDVDSRRIQL